MPFQNHLNILHIWLHQEYYRHQLLLDKICLCIFISVLQNRIIHLEKTRAVWRTQLRKLLFDFFSPIFFIFLFFFFPFFSIFLFFWWGGSGGGKICHFFSHHRVSMITKSSVSSSVSGTRYRISQSCEGWSVSIRVIMKQMASKYLKTKKYCAYFSYDIIVANLMMWILQISGWKGSRVFTVCKWSQGYM